MATAVRTMRAIGCASIYLTCAAGSLRPEVDAGRLMTITDHINLQGGNPLVGANDSEIGPRFPPLADAYDPALAARCTRRVRLVDGRIVDDGRSAPTNATNWRNGTSSTTIDLNSVRSSRWSPVC